MAKHIQFEFLEAEDSERHAKQTLILFHGYGADAYDLRSLAPLLEFSRPTQMVFPQGILAVPLGPGWMGRAWWAINFAALQATSPDPTSHFQHKPENLDRLREAAIPWVSAFQPSGHDLIVGGFSQGAMLSTEIFLAMPETPRALVIMSGTLINSDGWKKYLDQRSAEDVKKLKIFMSHGSRDPVLPFKYAQKLYDLFRSYGIAVDFFQFDGAHEISPPVLFRLNKFLKSV